MVQVRAHQPINTDGSINLEAWLDHTVSVDPALDREALKQACEYALLAEQQTLPTRDTWPEGGSFSTGLEIADILADLKLDQDSLVAAVLYRGVRQGQVQLQAVSQKFGPVVAKLIDGVQRMAAISASLSPRQSQVMGSQVQVENLRKMLVAMVDDVRVALIKLAERTCAIRAVKNADEEKRNRVAREVFDIYAPLAHRLGIGHIKWELEDLSFRYLEPDQYKQIAKLLHERRLDRERFISEVMCQLENELLATGVKADISGRAKHIYSIWRKMQRKGLEFSQIYDVRAVRVLVPEMRDCYTALGIVHTLWRHIPKEFDDYIANPKENGYRSLHTAVIGPEGKVLEVQIRTHAMHEEAELGVCAHWKYKGTDVKSGSNHYEEKTLLVAPGARMARGTGGYRWPGGSTAGRYRAGPGLRVHAGRSCDRSAQGRYAARFRLSGTHRDRSQLPWCEDQRAYRAAQLQPADWRAGGDHHQQARYAEP